jgi:hypothetical protein
MAALATSRPSDLSKSPFDRLTSSIMHGVLSQPLYGNFFMGLDSGVRPTGAGFGSSVRYLSSSNPMNSSTVI